MELRTMKYFLTIAEKKNITSAAKALHMTQPTLSRQMNELESELGAKLFVRTNRNTLLTEEGVIFKQRVEDILSLVERTEGEFNATTGDINGNVNIGSVETESMHIIIETISKLHQKYPHIRFNFYNGNSDELLERLDIGLIDFCLCFGAINDNNYHKLKLPDYDTTGILMRKDSEFAGYEGLTLTDAKKMPLLISSRFTNETLPLVNQPLSDINLKDFNIIGTFNQVYNAILMVKSGVCNAISIGSPLRIHHDPDLCFIPFSPQLSLSASLIWKKNQMLTKANRAFINELQSSLSS